MLAITHPPVLPSAMLNDVGTPVAIISQLNALPALPPVNASMAALRLATHDSGPGWLATPFLYDSFIHNSTPVLSRRTQHPARGIKLVTPPSNYGDLRYAFAEDPNGVKFEVAQRPQK